MTTSVTVKVYFESAHRLHNPSRSDEWNRATYGKCNHPYGHGHNYVLEATVQGDVDPETGYLVDMKVLKDVLRERIVAEVDHRHMNHEVSWLEDVIPTSENLVRAFYNRVATHLPEGIELTRMTLHETERSAATYEP